MYINTPVPQESDFFSYVIVGQKFEKADLNESYRLVKQQQTINLFFNSLLNF